MYTIKFKFKQAGILPIKLTNVEPGQTILELALNNNIELHHDCGGICKCTTCHLFIEKGMEFIDEISLREKHFLHRTNDHKINSRLGCQALLLNGKGEIGVIIPDQSYQTNIFN